MKILIIEDDPFLSNQLCQDIRHIFNEYFDPIYQASTVTEACTIINEKAPDILLIDIKLGDDAESGIKLAAKIMGKIPFIFVSGLPESVGFEKAKYTLPVAFLNKPYVLDQLKRALSLAEVFQKNNLSILNPVSFSANDTKIFVTTGRNEYKKIAIKELLFIRIDDHYLEAFLVDHAKPIVFKGVLQGFYTTYLYNDRFYFKLSRSLVVNIRFVKKLKDNKLFLKGFEEGFSIPKKNKPELMKLLEIPYK